MIKRIIILGALALACGVGFRLSKAPAPPGMVVASADTGHPDLTPIPNGVRQRWEPVWTSPVPDLTAAGIASDGSSVSWMDTRGAVRRLDVSTGKTLWQTPPLPGMNRLAVAPGGDVFVYSALNRLNSRVRLLDRDKGAAKGAEYPLNGAVWSVAISDGGANAFVGTGQGTVYTIPIRPTSNAPFLHPTTWPASGIPQSLAVSADGSVSVISTWDTRTVSAWLPVLPSASATPEPALAHQIWRAMVGEPSRRFQVTLSSNGTTAVGISACGRRGADPRVEVWDAHTGALLWQESYEGFDARALPSADGRYIAVTYAEMSDYKSGSIVEHRLCLYSRDGAKMFIDKGGLYFSPELVGLSADGTRVTVRSGNTTLYSLDEHGSFRSKLSLPVDPVKHTSPSIRECYTSTDGHYLLILRGDGVLSLYRTVAA